ncbi:respiratory-chain NADH dehydrogenase domain-containing protein [Mesorhizobium alhagi CCNWXJ12-2]|jgi:formate dehydrogenase|uniref:Respiratory-chain NADH dehydrogenase domain-containing protein n=2 Tax=Allomesorhizobium alhagi TaxID=475067 RepID=H0HQ69_9HYPH|nr:respiratory-chain NADH dehydrogenase domain-containing protein [Mesorhizobium alhagi CCNWXJ12-2]
MTMQERRPRDRGPKGRVLDDAALAEVRELLGGRERRRDLLIEFLHLIQDRYGCLSAAHLRALAEEMRLAQAEVYEVATFYDHFDVVKEGEGRPAPLTIRVCDSISCMLAGAEDLIGEVTAGVDPKAIRVVRAPCMGRCATAPAARIGDREVDHASSQGLLNMAREGDIKVVVPDYIGLEAYRAAGGYQLLQKVRDGLASMPSWRRCRTQVCAV